MHVARLLIVFLLIMVVIAYTPQGHEKISQTWENARPTVVYLMDNLYAAVRDVIAGSDIHNRTNNPDSPDGNFNRIIT